MSNESPREINSVPGPTHEGHRVYGHATDWTWIDIMDAWQRVVRYDVRGVSNEQTIIAAPGVKVEGSMSDSDMVERRHLVTAWESRDAMAAECTRIRTALLAVLDAPHIHAESLARAEARKLLRESITQVCEPDLTQRPIEYYQCENCGMRLIEDQLEPITSLHERVAPGEIMPAGECPECGSLCHRVESSDGRKVVRMEDLVSFVGMIARMTTWAETDTDSYRDDAPTVLSGVIEKARELLK